MGFNLIADYRTINVRGVKKKVLKSYVADCYDRRRHPKRKRISLGTKDKRVALQRLAKLERDYALELRDPWMEGVGQEALLLKEAAQLFLKSRKARGNKPKTLKNYCHVLELFARDLPPDLPLTLLASEHVERFLLKRTLNSTSRTSYLRHLRVFFRWSKKQGYIAEIPEVALPKVRTRKHVADFLTRPQYEKLIRLIEAEAILASRQRSVGETLALADIVRFAVHTGLRRGEICNLRWSAVNLQTRYVTVKNTETFETKSGHERSVYLAGDAYKVIARLSALRQDEGDSYVFRGAKGGQLSGPYLSKRFRHFRRMAGLPEGIRFHSLRHTFASWAVMAGMSLYKLKEITGHKDIQTVMIYAHLQPDAQKSEMERIFGCAKEDEKVES